MPDITEAQVVLAALGMPSAQCNAIAALTLLALCGLKPADQWSAATRTSRTITKGVMAFISDHYHRNYAPNTRETFRRQVLHQFVQGRIADYNPDNPSLPTNSPRAHYAISEAALAVVRTFGTDQWKNAVIEFNQAHGSLLNTSNCHAIFSACQYNCQIIRHLFCRLAIIICFRFASSSNLCHSSRRALFYFIWAIRPIKIYLLPLNA